MRRYRFITQIPVHTGALHRAVEIVAAEGGNINRIHYDRKIDLQTVFWEITCDDDAFVRICTLLKELGYLQQGLHPVASVKLTVRLPHEPGALNALLRFTTDSSALITTIAFDDAGSMPDTMTLTVDIEENTSARALIDNLAHRFQIEEIRFEGLEDTSFYVQFAKRLGDFVPDTGDGALVDLVAGINRVAQDLMRLGEDPKVVFNNVLAVAQTIAGTCEAGFYADIQTKRLSDTVMLYVAQPPCGGNVYLFETRDAYVMLDTGYGAYHKDMMRLFASWGLDVSQKLVRIIISHGDADHCGAAGFFRVPTLMHAATLETIRTENRAWGSPREDTILETVYSKMIAAFSKCAPVGEQEVILFGESTGRKRGAFAILSQIAIGDLSFEVLESLGGHQVGQIFLFCPTRGFLFSADSLIHLAAISPERSRYNRFADSLMTTVNVDSITARKERRALLDIAAELRRENGVPCTLFCGHGPICIEQDGQLQIDDPAPVRYTHRESRSTTGP